jgi:hypothetical protein
MSLPKSFLTQAESEDCGPRGLFSFPALERLALSLLCFMLEARLPEDLGAWEW